MRKKLEARGLAECGLVLALLVTVGGCLSETDFTETDSAQVASDELRLLEPDLAETTGVDPALALLAAVTEPAPRIVSTTIEGVTPVNGVYSLVNGQRYTVLVRVMRGTAVYKAAVEMNDMINIPISANLHNAHSYFNKFDSSKTFWDFRFTLCPTQTASHQIGFMMRDVSPEGGGTGNAFNRDGGVFVSSSSPKTGIHGVITSRASGTPIGGAQVTLSTGFTMRTSTDGRYWFAQVGRGANRITVTRAGYSLARAVNIPVPVQGIRVDVALEESFAHLVAAGISYSTYLDYSNGRTTLHVVRVPKATSRLAFEESRLLPSLENGFQVSARLAPLVTINAGYFEYDEGSYYPVGYYFSNGYRNSHQFGNAGKYPVLGITGSASNQVMRIVQKENDFHWSPDWHQVIVPPDGKIPLWDDDLDDQSDVSYAIQSEQLLLREDGYVPDGLGSTYWARTTVGVDWNGDLLVVVADGEGIHANQGASLTQLSSFYRDVLGAKTALNFDGGGSTQLIVRTANGYRSLTTLTAEGGVAPNGRVLNYLAAWKAPQ